MVIARSSSYRLSSTVAARAFASLPQGRHRLLRRSPDDVVITFARRTPIGRAKKGQFKDTPVDELLAALLKATFERTKIDPAQIDDIAVGTCHPPSPLYLSRSAALSAGIPAHVPIHVINRLCSSGLMAVRSIVQSIQTGDASLGIALGVESMSLNPRPTPELCETVSKNAQAQDCVQPMGWTSEMVAETYKVSREKQDYYALLSHTRAAKALESGVWADEILPIRIGDTIHSVDDTIRAGTTAEGLAKLKPAFPQWGTASTTPGNASGVGDGAAIAVITTRERAEREGWDIACKWAGCSVVGVEPRYMGIAPVYAIPRVLEKLGLQKEDIDLWEINEAFASQFAYCIEQLDISMDKINPNGGAIALAHPLGMTGIRMLATGLAEIKRRNEDIFCTSMCIGSGMGAAAIYINERN